MTHFQCHVFAELDLDQPARAIVNFVNKLMMSTSNGAGGRPADMVWVKQTHGVEKSQTQAGWYCLHQLVIRQLGVSDIFNSRGRFSFLWYFGDFFCQHLWLESMSRPTSRSDGMHSLSNMWLVTVYDMRAITHMSQLLHVLQCVTYVKCVAHICN